MKRNIIIIAINTSVMIFFFLIKFILLPQIPDINLSSGSDLNFLLTWVSIPLISIIGMALQQHVRFWIIPDFVYCVLSFAVSGEDCPYNIGMSGFAESHYSRGIALLDRLLTFGAILFMQFAIKLLIRLVKKLKMQKSIILSKKQKNNKSNDLFR